MSEAASEAAGEAIVVWQQPDSFWRWGWVSSYDPADAAQSGPVEADLVSFKAFESRSEALESAAEAYPDLTSRRFEVPRYGPGGRLRPVLLAVLGAAGAVRMLVRGPRP